MNILILTTQPHWKSWETKLSACRGALGIARNLGPVRIDKEVYKDGVPPVTAGKISRAWFNKLTLNARARGYHAVVVHCSRKEAKAWGMQDGLRGTTINDELMGEMWLNADEDDVVKYDSGRAVNRFVKVFVHECSHWFAKLLGQPDKTHYWDYERNNIMLAFTAYTFPVGILQRIQNTLVKEALRAPLDLWNAGILSQPFGAPSKLYRSGIHAGIDMAVPVGTPVIAPTDGRVTTVWKGHAELGNACLFEFYYQGSMHTLRCAHLKAAPTAGGYRRGDTFALTGNTGKSTGPHLHLELWRGGYNPDVLLDAELIRSVLLNPFAFFYKNKTY